MDLNAIISQLSQRSTQSAQDIKTKMAQADPNDPDQMMQAQFAMQQYSNFIGYESALIKTVKDMVQGIIAKI
ncbi:type III secretion system needle filament subunit SctF [Vibrio ostreicida]|uniref:Type III secretion system needle filament subunit SctF n=1 Tax=Vibrio ostreicida TaxID=526588 RepID=A0ABT8BTB1_9VIBR|nr:type III secretion system needle filament subunit SctF [Vibrio ostreicida]MDN3610017.1 type III secretion system needle filament subunit SctF [Vibrio ostreicida]MDN3611185.1 type III secretion system needle filament subunit SctF [Vibrio ostreicida]NPD10442.1 type III secretion system needle protein SsaG [Vibrio ostreicida]